MLTNLKENDIELRIGMLRLKLGGCGCRHAYESGSDQYLSRVIAYSSKKSVEKSVVTVNYKFEKEKKTV